MRRALAWIFALMLLTAGCSKGAPAPAEQSGTQPPVSVQDPPAARLLPEAKSWYTYKLSDGTTASEYYVRDGERLVGTYNGKTYVTWLITPEGIWRRDPKGQALLRYLPAEPAETAWKQASGSDEVWFRLAQRKECPGSPEPACWELTVLNRLERTSLYFAKAGIFLATSENWGNPAESYRKERQQTARGTEPPLEQILKDAVQRPKGPLPKVTEVSRQEFERAQKAMLARAGRPSLEIDLNGDGRPERVEGRLGAWHREPMHLYDSEGNEWSHRIVEDLRDGDQHRLEAVRVGDRPALLYQEGPPESWHSILLWMMDGENLGTVRGWLPKTDRAWGASASVQPDGTIVVGSNPADLGGYSLTRRYRIEPDAPGTWAPYLAKLLDQKVAPGPYPTLPDDLLTAAFMAKWYGHNSELERYIPDAKVRDVFKAQKINPSPYRPSKAEIGTLKWRTVTGQTEPFPEIEKGAPGAGGEADFQVIAGQWEGYNYFLGRVTFAQAGDGRLVIQKLEFGKSGFIY